MPYTNTDPASRNVWGADENRNNTVGTICDGYIGASHSCTSEAYTGPGEASEPEIKNELWVADTFQNIKFSNNIHSFGGYFMWAPGTYLPNRDEGEAVHANIGVEKYFFEAGDQILNRIKEVRGTVILPERTGPIADVLYSAAGNSADEHWYRRGVIAYSFETGADRFVNTTLSVASAAGATGIRPANRTGFQPGDTITFDKGRRPRRPHGPLGRGGGRHEPGTERDPDRAARRSRTRPAASSSAASSARASASSRRTTRRASRGARVRGRQLRPARVGVGVLEGRRAAEGDHDGRRSPRRRRSTTTFQFVNEPSVIRYTTDGSTPNATSTLWDSTGPREPGEVVPRHHDDHVQVAGDGHQGQQLDGLGEVRHQQHP